MNFEIFDSQLNQIYNQDIKNFTIETLKIVSPDIEIIPASTSKKYHLPECCEPGGLILHIKRACAFANLFFNMYNFDNQDIRGDIIISALLLHDIGKQKQYKHYLDYANHPITATKFLKAQSLLLPQNIFDTIKNCVLYHMGPWTPKSYKKDMPKYTFLELTTYLCDNFSSKQKIP